MSEYGRQGKKERGRNKGEGKRKTYQGREAWMGHIYTHAVEERGQIDGNRSAFSTASIT